MKAKLSEIADITAGFLQRESKKPAELTTILIIQLRDLNVNGTIDYDHLRTEDISSKDKYPELFSGDVIFAAKGSKRSAGVIDRKLEGTTVSNHYLIIRIKDDFKSRVLSSYLACYLRQKPAMDYFDQCGSGSHIPFVSAAALKELEVELPPIEKQKTLAELGELIGREDKLEKELFELRKLYYKNSLEKVIRIFGG
jgi:restriction endonuclease S subunit